MTYSATLKEKMLGKEVKKPCCSKAFLLGLLMGSSLKELETGDPFLVFRTEQSALSDLIFRLLPLRFGKEAEGWETSRPGHRIYWLKISAKPIVRLHRALRNEFPKEPGSIPPFFGWKCAECRTAFYRGLFLGCGSMSEPKMVGSLHLEFRCPKESGEALFSLLSAFAGPPSHLSAEGYERFYYKRIEEISNFFSGIGENDLYFELANLEIVRGIRKEENRKTNYETGNLQKTVRAAVEQITVIKALCESGEIDKLDDDLRETAFLRLKYDNDSLASLANRHEPPLTKSGLVHRLKKILAFAYGEDKPESLKEQKRK